MALPSLSHYKGPSSPEPQPHRATQQHQEQQPLALQGAAACFAPWERRARAWEQGDWGAEEAGETRRVVWEAKKGVPTMSCIGFSPAQLAPPDAPP